MKNFDEKMDEVQRYRHLQSQAYLRACAEENRRKRWQEILRNNPPAQFRRLPADDTEGGEV